MKTKDIVNIAMLTTLLCVCAWIYIPMTIPFTMQTFAVFLAMFVLGGKKGLLVISTYLFLGMIGMPVFSGGTAGPGVLFGPTGGYMLGWFAIGLISWLGQVLAERAVKTGNPIWQQIVPAMTGLLVCYTFGTLWYIFVYADVTQQTGIIAILSVCVFPYILPDIIKLVLAYTVSKRIKKFIVNV